MSRFKEQEKYIRATLRKSTKYATRPELVARLEEANAVLPKEQNHAEAKRQAERAERQEAERAAYRALYLASRR